MNLHSLAISSIPWACCLAVMLSSCVHDSNKIDEAESALMVEDIRAITPLYAVPEIVVEYYPYPVIPDVAVGVNSEIYPSPRYYGWIDERMRRDVERISEAGIDVIMLSEKRFASTARILLEEAQKSPDFALKIDRACENVIRFKLSKGIIKEEDLVLSAQSKTGGGLQ